MLKIMVDPASPPACRLNAAHRVIEIGLRGIEVEDMQARVSALERKGDHVRVSGFGDLDDAEDDCETDKAA